VEILADADQSDGRRISPILADLIDPTNPDTSYSFHHRARRRLSVPDREAASEYQPPLTKCSRVTDVGCGLKPDDDAALLAFGFIPYRQQANKLRE
jgi:hypothetical protein